MSKSEDCEICFGTGVLVKTEEINCPHCKGQSLPSCPSCKGFGKIRQQVSEPCRYCRLNQNQAQQTNPELEPHPVVRPQKTKASPKKFPRSELAMLMALSLASLIALLMLRGSNNIPVVVTVFVGSFLLAQAIFKLILKRLLD